MFRFTIRDLLWLMVVVALAFGWWRGHQMQQWSKEQYVSAVNSSLIADADRIADETDSEKIWLHMPGEPGMIIQGVPGRLEGARNKQWPPVKTDAPPEN